jgi:hypothetical protein
VKDRILGSVIGFVTNIIPHTSRLRDHYTPDDAAEYNKVLKRVDDASEVAGVVAEIIGAGITTHGFGTASGATGSIVLTAGVSTPIAVPVAIAASGEAVAGIATSAMGVLMKTNAQNNKTEGYDRGRHKPKSVHQLNKDLRNKTKATRDIKDFHQGNPNHKEQDHVHFNDGAALNKDGSWKHGYRKLTNAEKEYLTNEGWNISTD